MAKVFVPCLVGIVITPKRLKLCIKGRKFLGYDNGYFVKVKFEVLFGQVTTVVRSRLYTKIK